MSKLTSFRVQRFKRTVDAAFDLSDLNVLVGGNNSGKSSIIQGLHFCVALCQSIALSDRWSTAKSLTTSLSPTQLIYSPSEDVYALAHGGRLIESENQSIAFDFSFDSGDACTIEVRKGRNRNIVVRVANAPAAKQLSSLEKPFSVFSPGLAGVAKREEFISDGVLLRTLARGDANLVLRNILLRLWGTTLWDKFLNDLHDVFPELEIDVRFNKEIDEWIEVQFRLGSGELVPLELAGTGVLQAMQILSYIHRFAPPMVVLDEPDSHLHPNNQRLMCALLRRLTDEGITQVLLTTHSRHVVDAIGVPSRFLWVRDGQVDVAGADDEIGVLLDIGALDIKERASQPGTRVVVFTEDENTRPLEIVMESSGLDPADSVILPYYGVTGSKQLRPLIRVVKSGNPKVKIVVHRDRDFMDDIEVEAWKSATRALGAEPFVTKHVDVEGYFLDENHLAVLNQGHTAGELRSLVTDVLLQHESDLTSAYVNGRADLARKAGTFGTLDLGKLAVEGAKAVTSNPRRYAGKSMLKAVRAEFRNLHQINLRTLRLTPHLADQELSLIAKKLPKQPLSAAVRDA